jgi:hypothetical protein
MCAYHTQRHSLLVRVGLGVLLVLLCGAEAAGDAVCATHRAG